MTFSFSNLNDETVKKRKIQLERYMKVMLFYANFQCIKLTIWLTFPLHYLTFALIYILSNKIFTPILQKRVDAVFKICVCMCVNET